MLFQHVFRRLSRKQKVVIPVLESIDSCLSGKNALITGGGSGIGFAIAKRFTEAGCRVVVAGRDKERLEYSCRVIGNNARSIVMDVRNVASLESKLVEVYELLPEKRIDILVNSAGFNPKKGFFDTLEDDFDNTFNTNVKGAFFLSKMVAKNMIDNKTQGHILNISSSSALRPAWSSYEISKWCIRGFTIGLADLLAPYGIVVNAIAPGPTATPMLGKNADENIDLPNACLGRYATPDEIANLSLILVSKMGSIIVGDTLYATGGSGIISLHR